MSGRFRSEGLVATAEVNVLLLNQYFPPDTSATAKMASLVAEALAHRNRVTVVAGRPSYDPAERHPFYLFRRQQEGNIVVERVGSTAFSRFRMRGRLSNYFSYLVLAFLRCLLVRTNVIIAMTDPPIAGIVGAFIATLRGLPFIYDIRDLYPEMAVAGQILRPGFWIDAWEKLHRWSLRRADKVIVLGEDMRERIVAKGVESERVAIVRDGALFPEAVPNADHPVAREIRAGFPFVVLHAGNLGFYGAWKTLIEAAKSLEKDGVGFVFVGDGSLRAELEASARSSPSVRFMPFKPPQEVPYVLAAGDLHVVTLRKGLEGVVVPSKLYPILAAGRPVLAVAPEASDVARIVRRSGCGVVVDPEDPSAVAAAVRALYQDRSGLERMGRQAREIARKFESRDQLRLFTQIVEGVGLGKQSARPAPAGN